MRRIVLWIRHRIVSAFLAAAVLASATLLAEALGWLGWLDAMMLRVVSPMVRVEEVGRARDFPQLVLIDQQAYADRFGLRSPLPRSTLSELLIDVTAGKPEVLLVDLQLEPAVEDDIKGRQLLDDTLLRVAKLSKVVLPVPETRVAELDRVSLQWMQSMCRGGVRFGLPDIRSHFGTVVRLESLPFAMGNIARPAEEGHASADHRTSEGLCPIALSAQKLDDVRRHAIALGSHTKSMGEPIRPGTIQRALEGAVPWRQEATADLMKVLRPRFVVVGGAYDNRDTFLVAGSHEPVPGGVIHVAELVSGIDEALFRAWVGDVVLGTTVSLCFLALWAAPLAVRRRVHAPLDAPYADVLAAHCELVMALLVWVLALVLAGGVFLLSGWLMERELWLNPGPMIAGLLLHTLLLKEEQEVESEREQRSEHKSVEVGQVAQGSNAKRESEPEGGEHIPAKTPPRRTIRGTIDECLSEHLLAPAQVSFVVATFIYVARHGH